jgi:hypothetical protein
MKECFSLQDSAWPYGLPQKGLSQRYQTPVEHLWNTHNHVQAWAFPTHKQGLRRHIRLWQWRDTSCLRDGTKDVTKWPTARVWDEGGALQQTCSLWRDPFRKGKYLEAYGCLRHRRVWGVSLIFKHKNFDIRPSSRKWLRTVTSGCPLCWSFALRRRWEIYSKLMLNSQSFF